ncbi:hypothetical protein QR680_003128 [Steinernema hermaphroditum]|uniref:Uncharacterized protein n=1 Tax=Steinernema hermaphroditum TaxID=289476 RepID=A0AA39H7D1_9BILA|nr:hypothetical protein QR680_003128 [Steinernema hermaphroditum]
MCLSDKVMSLTLKVSPFLFITSLVHPLPEHTVLYGLIEMASILVYLIRVHFVPSPSLVVTPSPIGTQACQLIRNTSPPPTATFY